MEAFGISFSAQLLQYRAVCNLCAYMIEGRKLCWSESLLSLIDYLNPQMPGAQESACMILRQWLFLSCVPLNSSISLCLVLVTLNPAPHWHKMSCRQMYVCEILGSNIILKRGPKFPQHTEVIRCANMSDCHACSCLVHKFLCFLPKIFCNLNCIHCASLIRNALCNNIPYILLLMRCTCTLQYQCNR